MSDTPTGWYRWYPRDFLASSVVRKMSLTAQGVYRALLDLQWEDGEIDVRGDLGVPQTTPNAKLIIRATDEEWAQFEPFISICFPDGKNPKLAELRDTAISARNKQIESGTKGGAVAGKGRPKQKVKKVQGSVRGTPNQTETETDIKESIKENSAFDVWKGQEGYQSLNEIWPRYQAHRKQKKTDPYTTEGLKALISKFENKAPVGMGSRLFVNCICLALEGNWQGLPNDVVTQEAEKLKNPAAGKSEQFGVDFTWVDNPDGTTSKVPILKVAQ